MNCLFERIGSMSKPSSTPSVNPVRGAFDAWVTGAESALKATFEVQNAGLAAGLALLDATSSSQRVAFQEFTAAAQRAQSAALEAFQAQVRATERVTAAPTPAN
jgi:hypothetical protein